MIPQSTPTALLSSSGFTELLHILSPSTVGVSGRQGTHLSLSLHPSAQHKEEEREGKREAGERERQRSEERDKEGSISVIDRERKCERR